jgi:hypothetical protein
MASTPRELARWRAHLEEVIGVEDAAAVVDPFANVDWAALEGKVDHLDQRVTLLDHRVTLLDHRVSQLELRAGRIEDQLGELRSDMTRQFGEVRTDMKELRRDLLRVTGAQFFALIAAVAAIVGLG